MAGSVDVHIGARVRRTREFREVSALALARAANMTRLRLESCESGLERFAALELIRIARRLAVEPQFFFNGLPGRETAHEVPLLLLAGMVVVSSNDNLAARRGDEDQNPLRVHR